MYKTRYCRDSHRSLFNVLIIFYNGYLHPDLHKNARKAADACAGGI